jgi:DNA repair protein RadC
MVDLKLISDDDILSEYNLRFRSISESRAALSSSAMVKAYLSNILDDKEKDREHFFCIFLDAQNKMITIETLFIGSLSTSAVYPREVIKAVLKHEAANIILAHNHPSGASIPSSSDRAVTKKLQTACASIDVAILDHIIIGDDYYSFADNRLL